MPVFCLASLTPLQYNGARYTDWFGSADARDATQHYERAKFPLRFDLAWPAHVQDTNELSVAMVDAYVEEEFQKVLHELGRTACH